MDEQDVVVLDTGSGYLKVGFSGEDAPRAVLPTVITTMTIDRTREEESALGDSTTQAKTKDFFGDKALQHFGHANAKVTRPVLRGEIQEVQLASSAYKEALENLWDHTFRNVLGIEQEELPILIADPLPLGQSTYAARQWVAEVMFERFKMKSLAIFNTAVLSLFSTGRTRGLVVESGEGLTQAVPVFEGYAIPHAINRISLAGADITAKVQTKMETAAVGAEYATNPQVMEALKERVCAVALDADSVTNGHDTADQEAKSFELPDGTIIQIGADIRMGAPEILFGGGESVQKICIDSIETCDVDLRQDLLRQCVVAGGTSMLPGLAPRLKKEMVKLLPKEVAGIMDVCADSQRRYAAWIGGSMFASLSTFDVVAISRQEWEDGKGDARSLVARKTF